LIDSSEFIVKREFLKEEFFYSSEHRVIYRALESLFVKGIDIDLITAKTHIEEE
jgi:replicative DNA helicase